MFIFIVSKFGEAQLVEQIYPRYRYGVPKGNKSIGYLFSLMEKSKNKLDTDEYSASQTTLEQIFNGFARDENHQVEERKFTQQSMGVEYDQDNSESIVEVSNSSECYLNQLF